MIYNIFRQTATRCFHGRRDIAMNRILLVEDDTKISSMLKTFLTTENFEVVTAFDGESTCQQFRSDDFSLVLLDLVIPKMGGMKIMERTLEHSTIPIIIISAKDTDSDKMLGLGLGTDDYISDFTMAGNAVFPGILTIISLGFAVLSIYNAESRDLI